MVMLDLSRFMMSERFNHVMLHIGTWGVNSINAEQRETEVYKAVSDGLVTSAKHILLL